MSLPVLGLTADNAKIGIDVAALVKTRALLTANSGAGKSWALRRILEQTHGKVQHLVIDLEGEFFTLRERFDYVLAGRGGDVAAEPRSAAMLARRLLELNASAILDLYELNPLDRILFVKNFITALVDAPKDLWHNCLVIVDEAHHFAPEDGSAESSEAIASLMSRGRKRGFAGILATQRLSKLSKDVAAEANNLIVGRCALDNDVNRAKDFLGLTKPAAFATLPRMKPGIFYVYGPALSEQIELVEVGPVSTSHPQAGTMQAKAPAPRAKVLSVLSKLTDLPKEAEAEARTVAELMAKNRALETELRKRPTAVEVQTVTETKEVEVSVLKAEAVSHLVAQLEKGFHAVGMLYDLSSALVRELQELRPAIDSCKHAVVDRTKASPYRATPAPQNQSALRERVRPVRPVVPAGGAARVASPVPSGGLKGPEQRILNAIAWLNSIGVERALNSAVAFVAGYSPGGAAYRNPRGALGTMGLIDYRDGVVGLTESGRAAAKWPDATPTREALHARVLDILKGPEQRILTPLLKAWPDGIANEALANAAGYEPGGAAYRNPRGHLGSLTLIQYRNGVAKASDFLFPDAGRE